MTLLDPAAGTMTFVARDEAALQRYNTFPKVTDIFLTYSVGIVTARDHLTIHWTLNDVLNTVMNFSRLDTEMARQAYELGKDARDWKVTLAQQDLKRSDLDRQKIVPILYRPFDLRYTYYTGKSRGFHCMPRPEVMRHMMVGDNLALITSRLTKGETFKHAQVTQNIVEVICMSPKTSNNGFVFPLYLYPESESQAQYSFLEKQPKRANLNEKLVAALVKPMVKHPHLRLYHYIYTLLYAPAYREQYAEFLRTDFPRVPFPADRGLFFAVAALGGRLVGLHLLQSHELDTPLAHFEGQGNNRVAKNIREGFHYIPDEQRICINPMQFFAPIPPEVWEYRIGGYQVCEKWLKDRRERMLSLNEIQTYCRIVTALVYTIAIQAEIDDRYPAVEIKTIAIQI